MVIKVTSTVLPLISVPVTRAPKRISRPCLVKIFLDSLAMPLSMMAKKSSIASSRTTSEPKRFQTEPNSKPITPAPITPKRLGTSPISRAPVESRIKSPSTLATGMAIGSEPEAKITLSASITDTTPSLSVSSTFLPASNLPVPYKAVTPLALNSPAMPLVSWSMMLFLRLSMAGISMATPLVVIP